MPNKKVLIFDFANELLFNNKVFDYNISGKISHTYAPVCYLYQKLAEAGIDCITPDIFLSQRNKYKDYDSYILSELRSSFTQQLIDAGAKPLILTCQESPFVATRFFMNLRPISSNYKYSFVFSGMKRQLSPKTQYRQMFFPESFDLAQFDTLSFNEKKLAVLMNSNKRIGSWKKELAIKILYGWSIKEIYEERFKIINYLAPKGGLDLYGPGWDKGGKNPRETENIKKIYRGFADDKRLTLKNYKFAFAFENAVFPGYVTEKIFDAMFAGCIPIYLGARDIIEYVPDNCFLDFRKFSSISELYARMRDMQENEYSQYINNIKKYLQSEQYGNFSQEKYARQILDIIKTV